MLFPLPIPPVSPKTCTGGDDITNDSGFGVARLVRGAQMAKMFWLRVLALIIAAALGVGCTAAAEPSYLSAPIVELDANALRPRDGTRRVLAAADPKSDGPPSDHERRLGLRWRFRAGSPSPGIAVGSDGTVYVPTQEGHVHAVAADGAFRWSFNCHAPATGVAVNSAGLLLVANTAGVLQAILPGGTGLWAYQAPHPFGTPLVVGGDATAYVGDRSDCLVAVSSKGGALWRAPIEGGIAQSPTLLRDGRVVVGTADGRLMWVEGVLRRRVLTLPATIVQPPELLSDGTILAVAGTTLVAALEGAEAWRVEGVQAAASLDTGFVTIGEDGICWWGSEGQRQRCSPLSWAPSARPAVGPVGRIFVPTPSGDLVVVAATGKVERVVPVARTGLWAPVVDAERGQVLAAAGDGVLGAVALGVEGLDR